MVETKISEHIDNLKRFLIKYTCIREKIIKEILDFYKTGLEHKKGINTEDIIEYLKLRKADDFHRRLKKDFIENKDYTVDEKRIGSNLKKIYYVKFECFCHLIMSSKSSKGVEYRDFFILLFKFIVYYNKLIDKSILNENKPCIYILMTDTHDDILKIGRATNLRERLKNYAVGRSEHPKIKFIMLVDDDKWTEDCVKMFFKKRRHKNKFELFKADLDELKEIIFKCVDMDMARQMGLNSSNKLMNVIFDDGKYIDIIPLDANN